jgi:hypothetical protein
VLPGYAERRGAPSLGVSCAADKLFVNYGMTICCTDVGLLLHACCCMKHKSDACCYTVPGSL